MIITHLGKRNCARFNVHVNTQFYGGINMKTISITLAVLFIIVTLGFIDVNIVFSDGTSFEYRGWSHCFIK